MGVAESSIPYLNLSVPNILASTIWNYNTNVILLFFSQDPIIHYLRPTKLDSALLKCIVLKVKQSCKYV